jgi:hypothetical protein
VRFDLKINTVNGIKVLDEVTIRRLDGLTFNEWNKKILKLSSIKKLTIIIGVKTFNELNIRILE